MNTIQKLCMAAALGVSAAGAGDPAPADARLPVKILVRGSPLHGANGLAFDRMDRLYIASVWGNEIVVMDSKSGRILDRIGPDKGVFGPDDLTFAPDGSLYWASILEGKVGRILPDGTVKTQAVAAGTNPISITGDGRVFVGLCILGDGLFELDPALELPPRAISKPPGMLNGFDFGPDGLLYAPVYFEGRVVRMDVDSATIRPETLLSGLEVPAAVKFDSRGLLYGTNQLTGEVWTLNPASGLQRTIARLAPGTDNLAFDSRDRLFVSHMDDGSIQQILMGAARTVSPGGMILPGGVAVVPGAQGGDSIFVGDTWNLREFDAQTGKQLSSVTSSFALPGGITSPLTVAADGGNVIVSSWIGSAVQVWNPRTSQVVENHGQLGVPIYALRFQNDLVYTELGSHSVIRLGAGGPVTITDSLIVPTGLAAAKGDLWVADWATGMVWKIMAAGAPVRVAVAQGLAGPEGLAVDPDGSLLVVESRAGRLSRIDPATGNVAVVADGLELGAPGPSSMPPTWMFNGVAVSSTGAIYVTGDKANVLYRLR